MRLKPWGYESDAPSMGLDSRTFAVTPAPFMGRRRCSPVHSWRGGLRRASASHAIRQSRQPVAHHGVGWTEHDKMAVAPSIHGGAVSAARVHPTPSANLAIQSQPMAWDGRERTITGEQSTINGHRRALLVTRLLFPLIVASLIRRPSHARRVGVWVESRSGRGTHSLRGDLIGCQPPSAVLP